MRFPTLSVLLFAAALTGAPSIAVLAAPATSAYSRSSGSSAATPSTAPTEASDADQYAAREAADGSVADFQGGNVYLIGGSALTLALVIVLLVILL